jgi:hypothetical protein
MTLSSSVLDECIGAHKAESFVDQECLWVTKLSLHRSVQLGARQEVQTDPAKLLGPDVRIVSKAP